MQYKDLVEYWKKNSISNIMPKRGNQEFPEGKEAINMLQTIVGESVIVEWGCGRGRLSPLFHKHLYSGIDISERAIKLAKKNNPEYNYIVDIGQDMPGHDVALLYTVALHIPASNLYDFFDRIKASADKLIIAEIMNPLRANLERMPPTISKTPNIYIDIAENVGWKYWDHFTTPYLAYKDEEITFLVFDK